MPQYTAALAQHSSILLVTLLTCSSLMLSACIPMDELPAPSASAPTLQPTPQIKPTRPALRVVPAPRVSTAAPQPTSKTRAKPKTPLRYVVKKGDTLWDIANIFLNTPWYWPELWYYNPKVRNPHLIFPGDVLLLVNGRLVRAGDPGTDTVRLSPKIRVQNLEEAIPTIPAAALAAFLRGPRYITHQEWQQAGYVLGMPDPQTMAAAGQQFYARKLTGHIGQHWQVLRTGQPYKDPQTEQVLGYEMYAVARAQQLNNNADPQKLHAYKSQREILIGDRILPPLNPNLPKHFQPRPAPAQTAAKLLAVFGEESEIGQYQIITISHGQSHGIQPGHVVAVMRAGRVVEDKEADESVRLPDERSGVAMVFQVEAGFSHALVMESTHPLHVGERVIRP